MGAAELGKLQRGLVVAVIGPDASGKSTLCAALAETLQKTGPVVRAHLGWPPESILTWLPRRIIRLKRKIDMRWLEHGNRHYAADLWLEKEHPTLAVLTAFDRYRLARACQRKARKGSLVIADRWPVSTRHAPTGPTLDPSLSTVHWALARAEVRISSVVPKPDLVIRLSLPLDEALRRNAHRPPPKPERIIEESHRGMDRVRFPGVPEVQLDATQRPRTLVREAVRTVDEFLDSVDHSPGRAGVGKT